MPSFKGIVVPSGKETKTDIKKNRSRNVLEDLFKKEFPALGKMGSGLAITHFFAGAIMLIASEYSGSSCKHEPA